ncbi:protease inhibitor I42 family protein [Pseudomonas sp. SP16.1]|uniref:protease inhibitor I42 family protein n=1 Tax=Pseudomonas sp. SP16.1 TaxID=3458854 RepID=UPI0040454CDB
MIAAHRLLPLAGLALLAACAHQPSSLHLSEDAQCPLTLDQGQQLILSLPSNPTTGFRWILRDAAPALLHSLGPEVYSNPEDAGLVGAAGQSTWRFQAREAGEGRLLLTYQRPWETAVAPARTFDCELRVK